jgi:hypothetical protein
VSALNTKIEKLHLAGGLLTLSSFFIGLEIGSPFVVLPVWIGYNILREMRGQHGREFFERMEIPELRNLQRGLEKGLRSEEGITFGLLCGAGYFGWIGIWEEVIFLGVLAGGMAISCLGEELELALMERIESQKANMTSAQKYAVPLAEFASTIKDTAVEFFQQKRTFWRALSHILWLLYAAFDVKIYRKSRASIAKKL